LAQIENIMSVQTLDLRLYEQVYVTIARHIHRNDELRRLSFGESQLRIQMKLLVEMNYVSYYTRYPNRRGIDWEGIADIQDIIDKWNYNTIKAKHCTDAQLLKHLQCISYQIESENMKARKTWKLDYDPILQWLNNSIHILLNHLVSSMPEYKEAKWGYV
jgi:hypothetical protein